VVVGSSSDRKSWFGVGGGLAQVRSPGGFFLENAGPPGMVVGLLSLPGNTAVIVGLLSSGAPDPAGRDSWLLSSGGAN
jgi:hypothetical protein